MDIINFLFQTVRSSMAFLFGSTGEILTEKSGHLNLGIPGTMCVGAACGAAAHTRHVHRRRSYGTYLLLPCCYVARQPERYGSCSHNARYRRFRLYDLACRGFQFFDRKQILHGISPVCGQTRRVRQTHILLRRNGLSFHCCRSYLRICS